MKRSAVLERLASLSQKEQEQAAKLLELDFSEFQKMIAGAQKRMGTQMPPELQSAVSRAKTTLDSISSHVPSGFELVISYRGVSYRKSPGRRPAGMPPASESPSETVVSRYPPKPRGRRGTR